MEKEEDEGTNQYVNEGRYKNCPVTTKISVCYESSYNRKRRGCSSPRVHVHGGVRRRLSELFGQVSDHIACDSNVSKSLCNFHT